MCANGLHADVIHDLMVYLGLSRLIEIDMGRVAAEPTVSRWNPLASDMLALWTAEPSRL